VDDRWLVQDRNENGLIDDGSELFGNAALLRSGAPAENGYQLLAELDQNGDLIFDAADPDFARLRVWGDANRNGLSEPSELATLDGAGIESISLDYRSSHRRDRWGNVFPLTSKIRVNGRASRAADVVPATAPAP